MAMLEINWNPTTTLLRHFAWLLAGIVAVAGAWSLYRFDTWLPTAIVWISAALVALVGWRAPQTLRLIYVAWLCAAFPLAWLISHLLLAGVYYVVITPIGLVLRCLRHDPLGLKGRQSAESYWTPRKPVEDQRRYFRQF